MPKNLKQDLNAILERTDIYIEPEVKTGRTGSKSNTQVNSPKDVDPLNPINEQISSEELIIRRDEWRKVGINNRLKSKLADNIPSGNIVQSTWINRLFSSIPRGVDPKTLRDVKVVIDTTEMWPSFFEVMMCSLDGSLIAIYSLIFIEFEIIWGNRGNSMLSIFIVYLVELFLRKMRHYLGQQNLAKKAHLDSRFLN